MKIYHPEVGWTQLKAPAFMGKKVSQLTEQSIENRVGNQEWPDEEMQAFSGLEFRTVMFTL